MNVFFEALAVFTWFKYRKYNNDKMNRFISVLSKYSFGAYLVHVLIIEQLNTLAGINTLSFNSIFSVICIGVFVTVVSFVISALLNNVPVARNYMV